ncbi:MAG: 50S ribosomal protein L5 [Bdellovibrionales bacterium CG10_big_fil_rev_8_21_14_0_10_45_34]|nr:MAG: 50S ribosomal protein L5 [Bdellovibrionales bacterium CG10_big_fil_rev_8_21_14_0_10_45_34]
MNRLEEKYRTDVIGELSRQFSFKNPMQVPRLNKIVVNVCVGEATQNSKLINTTVEEIAKITGQKPVVTKAKQAISNFKLRKGMPIGCCVTLRNERMWAFMDRLVSVALPRVRDFKGLPPKGFDGRGNYNMGLKEQIVFPEIDYDKVDSVRGMNITFGTSAKTDEEGRALLSALGMPFRK